jgi:trans-2,3-dihydro-3-hydroxyanthranilate isomerase
MQIKFSFVDVFADEPLTGNPLAVVGDAQRLDESAMQSIAREFNQAETTFLFPPRSNRNNWRLRSFTASGQEVFGAGHNALGAWWWLAESGALELCGGLNSFIQEIGDHRLPVEVRWDGQRVLSVTLTQTAPASGEICEDMDNLARSLGLEQADLFQELFPAQVISTGAAHLLVPVRTRQAVDRARPDSQLLAKTLQLVGGQGCYIFCLDTVSPNSSAYARFFNPTAGIVEDSATGSAAGPLACQLMARGIVGYGETIAIEQGYGMGRPSLLNVEVRDGQVRLAGRCILSAEGQLRIK